MRKYDYICSLDGCEREHHSRGMCMLHYGRWHRTQEALRILRDHRLQRLDGAATLKVPADERTGNHSSDRREHA